jgi:hypothetical protein
VSDGREEREERKRRIEQEKREDREDRVNREDPDEWKPERVDSVAALGCQRWRRSRPKCGHRSSAASGTIIKPAQQRGEESRPGARAGARERPRTLVLARARLSRIW